MDRSPHPPEAAHREPSAVMFGMGLLVVAAIIPLEHEFCVRAGGGRLKDGGTLLDRTLPLSTSSTRRSSSDPAHERGFRRLRAATWGVADATCAMLFRYPVNGSAASRITASSRRSRPAIRRSRATARRTRSRSGRASVSAPGQPVTAANYKRAIDRVLNPAMNSPAPRYLQDVAGVRAAGNQLIVRLTKRVPDFPARMTMPYLCPVPTDLPVAPEGVGGAAPGSGPYYVAEFVRGSRVVLKRNPYYRGTKAAPPRPDRLPDRRPPGDEHAQGRDRPASMSTSPCPRLLDEVAARYGVNKTQFFSVRSPAMFYTVHEHRAAAVPEQPEAPAGGQLRARPDRDAAQCLGAPVRVAHRQLPAARAAGLRDVHPYPVRHPDLAKARALARGHTRSGKAVIYTCDSVLSDASRRRRLVQDALKQIGIDVEIKLFPVDVRDAKIATRGEPFDLADTRLDVAWVDPYQYVDLLLDGRTIQATGNTNLSYFNSPHYNGLIDPAASLSGQRPLRRLRQARRRHRKRRRPDGRVHRSQHPLLRLQPRRLRARPVRRARPRPRRPLPQMRKRPASAQATLLVRGSYCRSLLVAAAPAGHAR